MGRPRKPTAVLELTGAFRKNPQRKRTDPPATGPLGDPPEHFTPEQAVVWHELAAVSPRGVLTRSDRLLVEIAVVLMLRVRKQGPRMRRGELNVLISVLSRMGMSPADRLRVGIGNPQK
jgi:hypothetical protein